MIAADRIAEHYDPALTLAEIGDREGVSREYVRRVVPWHGVARRSVRALDEALRVVRGEVQEAQVQVGLEGEYRSGAAVWCEDCGRKIRGEGAEMVAHSGGMPTCTTCHVYRYVTREDHAAQCLAAREKREGLPTVRFDASYQCSGQTTTGRQCTLRALKDSDRCRWHQESS